MKRIIQVVDKADIKDNIDMNNPGKQVFVDMNGKVLKVLTVTGLETKVDDTYVDELDINQFVEKAQARGLLRATTKYEGQMDDLPQIDYAQTQQAVAEAKTMFETLPSNIRAKFNNNYITFAETVSNPDNTQMLVDLGLAKALDGKDKQGNIIRDSQGNPTSDKLPPDEETQ